MNDQYRDTTTYPLTNEEFMCLVIRECGTRSWSGHRDPHHCRFCTGVLYSARELRESGLVLDDSGQPQPRPKEDT